MPPYPKFCRAFNKDGHRKLADPKFCLVFFENDHQKLLNPEFCRAIYHNLSVDTKNLLFTHLSVWLQAPWKCIYKRTSLLLEKPLCSQNDKISFRSQDSTGSRRKCWEWKAGVQAPLGTLGITRHLSFDFQWTSYEYLKYRSNR